MRSVWHGAVMGSLLLAQSAATAVFAQSAEPIAPPALPGDIRAWRVERIALPDVPAHLLFGQREDIDHLRIVTRDGMLLDLEPCEESYCARAVGTASDSHLPAGAMPGTQTADAPADAKGLIASVWLADPVQRLAEGALGAVNAGALVVRDTQNNLLRLELPVDQAFVDLAPRVADLDGDKVPEIIVSKGQIGIGASLAIIKLAADGFHVAAESAPASEPGAWLKLAGIGDFNGDGRVDLAVVHNPGADGQLELYNYVIGYLQPGPTIGNVSNHAPGLNVTDMSVVGDWDGDRIVDLAVPSGDRMAVRFLSFATGQAVEQATLVLSSPIVTELMAIPTESGRSFLAAGLEDGSIALLGRPQ